MIAFDNPNHSIKHLAHFQQVDELTVVCGALQPEDANLIQQAGIKHVINFLPEDDLNFDESSVFKALDIAYTHIPLASAHDLKQINIMAFDQALRIHHGKKTLMHCATGDFVGAAIALRAGWLRGRKMETCFERGEAHGLSHLKAEVEKRLLVPR